MAFNGVTVTTVDYLGDLFLTKRRPNAFLKLSGGLQGGVRRTTSREFPIGTFYNLPAPSQPARLEGAQPPAPNSTAITQMTNVVQIFQEAVSLTYLAMSEHAVSGVVPIPQGEMNGPLQNPRSQEFQVQRTLEKIAQDANYSFLNGQYINPQDPSSTALGTRGILTAIATNLIDESAQAATTDPKVYRGWVNTLLASMIQYNGYQIDEQFVLLCGETEYSNIANAWAQQGTIYVQPEATVVGVKVRKVMTTFGTLLLALDPDVPAQQVCAANMDGVGVVGLEIPQKGYLFEEPLYKQGSSEQTQIYGQLGIDHGPEYLHGLLKVPAGCAIGS